MSDTTSVTAAPIHDSVPSAFACAAASPALGLAAMKALMPAVNKATHKAVPST